MELWKESINKVYLEGDSAWSVTASYVRDSGLPASGTLSPIWNATTSRFEAPLPYILDECTVTVTWTFTVPLTGQIVKVESYQIITPYVTIPEIKDALGSMPPLSDPELKRVERRIRGVVNNFTNQKFGKYTGKYTIQADGEENLSLPARLISLTSVTGGDYSAPVGFYGIRGSGWYLGPGPSNSDAFRRVWNASSQTWANKVIHSPETWRTPKTWRDNIYYTVDGVWGYENVPTNVKEAMLVLIEIAICPDSTYRDRYVEDVKTADYGYVYTPRAFNGTGSVVADQLLSEYVHRPLVVI